MFKKKLLTKRGKNYTLTFSSFANGMNDNIDENILPLKYAKSTYNFAIKSGALECGLGISRLTLPKTFDRNPEFWTIPTFDQNEGIINIWHHQYWSETEQKIRHFFVFHGEQGGLYLLMSVDPYPGFPYMFPAEAYEFEGEIYGMNYRLENEDVMIFAVPKESKLIVCGNYLKNTIYTDAPKLLSICKHYERLFAILEGDRKTLMFSANLDPTNWSAETDQGGFIQMYDERGKLLKLLSFNDYVYVFREFGITKISAYGDQEQFSVSHLAVSSSKIFAGSICACGELVMYMAEDGMYVFDGYTSKKLNLGIEKLFLGQDNEFCRGIYYMNKYYLSCRLDFDDENKVGCENETGFVNNALIEYDFASGELNILRGVDIKNMCVGDDFCYNKLVCCFNGKYKCYFGELSHSGKYFDEMLQKSWVSPYSNLGFANKLKIIKEIVLQTEGDLTIKIKTDKEQKTYNVTGKKITQRIKTNVRGELVQISFVSNTDGPIKVSSPQLTVCVV